MDFVKSHLEKMKLWPVEHFWLTSYLEKKWAKSFQLVRVSFFLSDFLQKPYFSLSVWYSTICTKFNVQIRAGRHLKGFGLASLSGALRGYMPPRLKKIFWNISECL